MRGKHSHAPRVREFAARSSLLRYPDNRDRSKNKKQKDEEESAKARERLYPGAATDIAPSLPLYAYAGSYTHPAYKTIDLVIKDGALHADVFNRTWTFTLDFEPVSGEHFIARSSQLCIDIDEAVKAEFSVDAKGNAMKLRLGYQEGTEMIEFARF
jgi:hypothetical protein